MFDILIYPFYQPDLPKLLWCGLLGRPERSEGLMFYCRCFPFLFFSPRDLRAPAADRRETLPHDQNIGALYNTSPKIRGGGGGGGQSPKEIRVPFCVKFCFAPVRLEL